MFPGAPRPLSYPLDSSVVLENEVPDGATPGQPTWAADSDERIFVVMEVSLNEYVQLASAIDAGRDPAYPDYSQYIWWLWCRVIHSMTFCEEMAQCFNDQNAALMTAVASAIASNPELWAAIATAISESGSFVPGRPLTDGQAAQDTLPLEVRDEEGNCIEDSLWGACLFLVQSANRSITDFFELLEGASNAIETSAIVANAVPAAGAYASAALEFADQLQENLSEGYAAAYTETYENDLACDIFCRALSDCELSMDMLVDIVNQRLPDPEDVSNFGLVMARVGSGTFTGPEIADAMMYIYFTALRFGQQFMDVLGIRPLTDLMGLGADQLDSNNWATLCDCPGIWEYTATLTELEFWDDYAFADSGVWSAGNGWGQQNNGWNGQGIFGIATSAPFDCIWVAIKISAAMTGSQNLLFAGDLDLSNTSAEVIGASTEWMLPIGLTLNGLAIGYAPNTSGSGYPNFPGYTFEVTVRGFGYQPPELGG